MAKIIRKLLIVEGSDDLSLISAIMSSRVKNWNPRPKEFAVEIQLAGEDSRDGGKNKIESRRILGKLKSGNYNLTHLGIVVDADNSFKGAQQKLQNIKNEIAQNPDHQNLKCEFWVMPDNNSDGMIEDLCLSLLKDRQTTLPLLDFATRKAVEAKNSHSAPYKSPAHNSKASLKTWLAWQDEPGLRMGAAVHRNILDVNTPAIGPFLNWFCNFFELDKI